MTVEKIFRDLETVIGRCAQEELEWCAEITGLSRRRVQEIWEEQNKVTRMTPEAVLRVIDLLAPSEVTSYKEIALVLGKPGGALAVGRLVQDSSISAADASRVIPTRKTRGAYYVMDDDEFESVENASHTRSSALNKTGVPHQKIGDEVLVPFSAFVDHTTLMTRAGR